MGCYLHDQPIAKTLEGTATPPPNRAPSRGRSKPSPSHRGPTSVMLHPAHLVRGHDHHSEELRTMTPIIAELVASGLNRPVFAAAPPGVEGVLYVAEQHTGLIRILSTADGRLAPGPFLQLDGLSRGNEQGLLGF